jgi:archaemetzincin
VTGRGAAEGAGPAPPWLALAPEGSVDPAALAAIGRGLSAAFAATVREVPPSPEPADAYDAARRQYRSADLLRALAARRPADALAILGVTERDLFIPVLRFVFGQALLGGGAGVVSLARLRPEFHRLAPDPGRLEERAVKESLHEMGHALGLVHCHDPSCVMSLSTQIAQVDRKAAAFCRDCHALVDEALAAAAAGRGARPTPEENP